MHPKPLVYAAIAAASVSVAVHAQTQAPGLWEHSMKMPFAGTTTTKVCITPEQAAKPPEARMARANCVQKDLQRSGNTIKFKMECTEPPMTGEGETTFAGDKAYSGKTTVGPTRGDKTQQMTMEMSGKWLAADCGDVKPYTPPPAKKQ